jgi:hypothetical protein
MINLKNVIGAYFLVLYKTREYKVVTYSHCIVTSYKSSVVGAPTERTLKVAFAWRARWLEFFPSFRDLGVFIKISQQARTCKWSQKIIVNASGGKNSSDKRSLLPVYSRKYIVSCFGQHFEKLKQSFYHNIYRAFPWITNQL